MLDCGGVVIDAGDRVGDGREHRGAVALTGTGLQDRLATAFVEDRRVGDLVPAEPVVLLGDPGTVRSPVRANGVSVSTASCAAESL